MYNQTSVANSQNFVKTINIIHTALLAGLILFSVVAYNINTNKLMSFELSKDAFFYLVPSFIIVGGITGIYLFNQTIKKAINEDSLSSKLAIYSKAFISKCALIEGPAMFGIVVFLLSGNLFYLLFSGLNIIHLAVQKPTKTKIEDSLNLSYEDKMMLG
ncbi:hypothetical protein JN11_03478 [Mucilaginibacter frigoritolerans]|uniref:Uncharacterized protein n=1 Tax=Mucilaginibacter frigoritolerans TaxID=652788 RepID=A0A562TVS0_9SPHI|nr:hypothetical protein [Mucilaginibacter frigoritolerans]TWI97655.1 hypothetical protein JN11_03478 [Mucilaginibacter frigoritolerans]